MVLKWIENIKDYSQESDLSGSDLLKFFNPARFEKVATL